MNRIEAERAVNALYSHFQSNGPSGKDNLLIETPYEYIWTVLTTKKIHKSSPNPHAIHLPHSFRIDSCQNNDVCLLVKAPASEVEALLEERGIAHLISKVIDLPTLRTTYSQFESRRALCDAYDFFLADDRIVPSLGKALGKKFFAKKKQPLAVKISEKDPARSTEQEIRRALESTVMIGNGTASLMIRTCITQLTPEQTVDNLIAVVEEVAKKFGGSVEEIVQSVHVKTANSPSFLAFLMQEASE
jgi:ribosome biogenesis protein UTP30